MSLCRQENGRGQISRDWARHFHRGAMPINSYTPKIFLKYHLNIKHWPAENTYKNYAELTRMKKNNIHVNLDFNKNLLP